MTRLTRRAALAGGAATVALAACNPRASDTEPAADSAVAPAGFRDGVAIAAAIEAGETTALAEVEAAIARARAVEEAINGIVTETFELARSDASGVLSGPFAGVPSFIKDLIDWRGAPTLKGSRGLPKQLATADNPFAAKWRGAGIVSLGKSATPEAGLISSTEPLSNGPTRNPWDLSRIPGGSSGGAAALVAARVVAFAHASDGGGSIRIPASTCGVFGMKPSRDRLPYSEPGAIPPPLQISVNHAVTLSVRDSIALFRAAEALDGTYPALGEIQPLTRRLRIGFAPEPIGGTELHPDTRAALEDVAQLCRDLGHTVIDYTIPMDGPKFTDAFITYWAAGAADFARQVSEASGKPIGPDIVEPWTLGLANLAASRLTDLPGIVGYLLGFEEEYHSFFNDLDILLTPVTGSPAVPVGEQAPDGDFDAVMDSVLKFVAYTSPMNVAGAASMSVPLAWSPAGLPIGAMFSGRRGDDALMFELALELEAARPWADRKPPLSAL
ncbi:putative 6-aminohexanoate-cyclic-dimer hydrolase [Hyphomonas neptunium ATCC 15444]|uniref:Putative 6-aminohexanoate-cyclic-dimer hydrolase n=2 Tax=Hyphomonas TaxID=85 RepID=Q0C3Z9_HYPNA|nr:MULTISPECIES: amidase family protein [Hyphomonas]ABI76129.1 putative 6-aminohexanoate-cyclic-dimer hydrolase [Hyphomonas neptunium ATCC 15444]KCZ96243.1 putative 6-aminohexanoate-cyclic-dimer hydrolase [Hyphomonas hirschiana VP5]